MKTTNRRAKDINVGGWIMFDDGLCLVVTKNTGKKIKGIYDGMFVSLSYSKKDCFPVVL